MTNRKTPEAGKTLMVSREEAARMVGVNVSTWDRWRDAGKTPAPIKVGGRTLFRRADLERWADLDCPDRKTFETLTRTR